MSIALERTSLIMVLNCRVFSIINPGSGSIKIEIPSASAREFIVEAVPMVMQTPAERDMPDSAAMKS